MERSHVTRLAVLQRAISFMDRYKAELGGVSESRPRVIIEESIAAIERHAGTQSFERTRSTSQTKVKHDLRETLRLLHMQPIAGICRMELARGRRVAKVRVPPKRADDADLLAAASGMADVAAKHKDLLIANGLPPDFIKELKAATSALRDALAARRGHKLAITRSTSAILLELRRGYFALQALNALVVKQLSGAHKDKLVAWRAAIRKHAKPGGPGAVQPPVSST